MKPTTSLALLLLLLVLSATERNAQQGHPVDEDVIRVDTTLVTLPVKVTNRQRKVAYGSVCRQRH